MSIVVKHSPDLSVMSELAYQGGKGQYNQWLANFQQQQENAKTQALLSGFGAGGQLGLGISGMRQRERMQKARIASAEKMPGIRAGAQSAVQAQEDVQYGKTMGGPLFDAVSQRYPLQPQMWTEVQQWPRERQEALIKWSDGVAGARASQAAKASQARIAGGAAATQADGEAFSKGSDRHQKQRGTIARLHKEGKISDDEARRYQQRLNQNIQRYGNTPVRPKTAAEMSAGDQVVKDLGNGKTSHGWYDKGGAYHELYQTPSNDERQAEKLKTIEVGSKALPVIDESINTLRERLKGDPLPDDAGLFSGDAGWVPTYEPNTPEENAKYELQVRQLEGARDSLISQMGSVNSGDKEHLPVLTQDWINRLEQNPNLAPWEKNYYIMLQRLSPSKYILDRPDLRHKRMNQMDTGDPAHSQHSRSRGNRDTSSMFYGTPEFPPPPPAPMDPPPPPMPRDERPDVPPVGTQAESVEGAMNIPGRLQKVGPDPQVEHMRQTKLLEESAGARRLAVTQAHSEHVRVTKKTEQKPRTVRGSMKAGGGRRPAVLADVEPLTPRPERLTEAGTGFEVELERLYNQFARVEDRTPVRYVQSMLRKYGYDINRIRSQASPEEQAAWHDAMKRVKQLKDASKRRR